MSLIRNAAVYPADGQVADLSNKIMHRSNGLH
jgi:hypothetical protein